MSWFGGSKGSGQAASGGNGTGGNAGQSNGNGDQSQQGQQTQQGQQGQQTQQADQQQSQGTQQSQTDDFSNFWNFDDTNEGGDGQPPQQQQQQDPNAFEEQMGNFIKSQNLYAGIDPAKLASELQEGKIDHLNEVISGGLEKVLRTAIGLQARFHQNAVDTAVNQALERSTSSSRIDNARTQLHELLPFTEKPNVSPIADAILQQAMRMHKNNAKEAVKATAKFFRTMQNQLQSDVRSRQTVDPQFKEIFPDDDLGENNLTPRGNTPNINFMKLLSGQQ